MLTAELIYQLFNKDSIQDLNLKEIEDNLARCSSQFPKSLVSTYAFESNCGSSVVVVGGGLFLRKYVRLLEELRLGPEETWPDIPRGRRFGEACVISSRALPTKTTIFPFDALSGRKLLIIK